MGVAGKKGRIEQYRSGGNSSVRPYGVEAVFFAHFLNADNTAGISAEIWQTMIPSLSSEEALHIAERFDFSGGQIENVARKQIIESILSDTKTDFDDLMGFCKDEPLESRLYGKIGFSSS
jgi:hypothetical protein